MFSTFSTNIIIATAVDNPLDGVTPSLSVFGVQFEGATQLILGGIWALVVVLVAGAFLMNLGKWGVACRRGHSDDIADGAEGAKRSGVALAAVASASVIIGGILTLTALAGA